MEFQRPLFCLCFVLFSLLSCSSQAYVFYAGGRDGWVLNPSEEYNHWAGRNRFQVNDTIVFKYKKGSNSVLVVNKDGYDKCNETNPIKKFEDGDSVFKFDRSGPFYFISGTDSYCEKGQKLIVVVLAIRSPPHLPPPPSPVPQPPPPPANQPSPAPSPNISPSSPSPSVSPIPSPKISPASPAPSVSPIPSPNISPSSPAPSVSPIPSPKISPASAPAPAKASPTPSPANAPANPPTSSPSPSPANSPTSSTPGSPPATPPANSPPSVPGSSGTPPSSQPGSSNPSSSNETSPPPPANGAWDVAPASLLVYVATIVLSGALSGILGG